MSRNKLIYLVEIYDLLIDKPVTFYDIRKKTGIGFETLKRLMDELKKTGIVIEREKRYYVTPKMTEIFTLSFYEAVKELKNFNL